MMYEGLLKKLVDAAYESGYFSGRKQDGQPHHIAAIEERNQAYKKVWRLLAGLDSLRAEIASYRDHPGREYCHYCHAIFDVPSEAADNHWRECQSHPLRAEVERLREELEEAKTLFILMPPAKRDQFALADKVKRLRAEQDTGRLAVAERAVNLLVGDIYETLMGMVSGWRDTAHDHYCQSYNKGMGEGLENCAKHLEAYLNGMYQRDRAAVARRAVADIRKEDETK